MANMVLEIQGARTASGQDSGSGEIYVDLDVESRRDSSMQDWPPLSADFLPFAEARLSSIMLSVQGGVESVSSWLDVLEEGVPDLPVKGTGLSSDLYVQLSARLSGEIEYTRGTFDALSAGLAAAQSDAEAVQEARQFPWRRRLGRLVNVNAVMNSVRQIFTWIPGERIINPEFGSRLRQYLYEPITDENQERLVAEIRATALKWEPRVQISRVVRVTNQEDVEENTVRLDIYYTIKGLEGRQFVYQYEQSRARYSKM